MTNFGKRRQISPAPVLLWMPVLSQRVVAMIESRIQGLRCMGSAHSSVRSSDGICLIHDRYLAADCSCSSHEPRLMSPMRQGPTAA